MSSSGDRTHLKLLTVGDLDPKEDPAIEDGCIGRVIAGRYTVRAHIGGGGMADVFRATDEQLGIDVAIKMLKPHMASDELRARMVQEARAAAQVRHDHLVRVFGTGKLDGTAYIAMELLDGPNLEQYVREYRDQRIPWREAIALLLPAIEALHAIHERGYVHRDIKPGNILVTREPGHPPAAIVIDLGLVKPDRALHCVTSLPTTEVGRMLCTPGYTSPEQAAGLPVDRRSDIYSMAVTLYRVLAGRLPFHDAHGQPVEVVLARHIYSEPTRLARAAAGADIPPAIAAVIESALRKSPGDRPQTMLEFAEALRAAVASVPDRTLRRPRLHELLAAGLGVAVILLAMPRAASLSPAVVTSSPDDNPPAVVTSTTSGSGATPAPTWMPAAITEPQLSEEADLTHEAARDPGPAGAGFIGARDLDRSVSGPPARPLSAAPTRSPRPAARRDPRAAYRRAFAERTPAVQACAKVGAGGLAELIVAVGIGTSGKVSTRLVGVAEGPLSRCVDAALRSAPVTAPSAPVSLTHTFPLPTTPP